MRRVGVHEGPPPTDSLHQRATPGARTRVPRQKISLSHRAQPNSIRPPPERGPGENMVPKSTRQVEKGESWARGQSAPTEGFPAEQEQAGCPHSRARQQIRRQESASAAGKGAGRLSGEGFGKSRCPKGRVGLALVPSGAAALTC